MSPPIYDPDAEKPERTTRPPAPTFYQAIITGVGRVKDPKFLEEYYKRWRTEIDSDPRKPDLIAAFAARKKELRK